MQEWTDQELQVAIQWKRTFCLYLYTPMCGTCQVASRMLSIVLEMLPDLTCGQMNINFARTIPAKYEIESVPCLLIFKEGQLERKIYAFQSVPFLYETLKELV
ncbi:thioredoxin family protein [Bacillus sp. V5-8f]|uniref:thioredoxin family protein n=1 Tax=Bacillus sp. V5-8f TaxID=2053044 RepID=UPI000C7695BB|nr:thioredoxin family protein [Bacillus sp. V5-8f]PLT33974.1 thiol reductase thioredoxin [Bacillus sp. V5-8f]